MNQRIQQVLQQFLTLSPTEQQALIQMAMQNGGHSIHTDVGGTELGYKSGRGTTINFAPTPGACPRCGK